jgi:hypothetical protein
MTDAALAREIELGSQPPRIEARVPGADANPYLAHAAIIVARLIGVEQTLPLPHESRGNACANPGARKGAKIPMEDGSGGFARSIGDGSLRARGKVGSIAERGASDRVGATAAVRAHLMAAPPGDSSTGNLHLGADDRARQPPGRCRSGIQP